MVTLPRVLCVLMGLTVFVAACATVVDLEVGRPEGGQEEGDRDGPDAGVVDASKPSPTPVADAGPDGPPGVACGCDAGTACCLPQSGASSCVPNDPNSCPGGATSMFLACTRPDTDGRDCCWNDTGPLARTTRGASCDRAACLVDLDCQGFGGSCQILVCRGMTVGVCAASLGGLTCLP